MIILLTNDDGVYAPGLRTLKDALEGLGDLWVVAPAAEQSGVSHAFSLVGPMRVSEVFWNGNRFGLAVNGTPVDAVKLAIRYLLPEMPALVVAGINRGENTGVDILYSGTVAGAMEGALLGCPAIAISQSLRTPGGGAKRDRWGHKEVDWTASIHYARRICEYVLRKGLPDRVMLNINIPFLPLEQIKGVRLTHQADSFYEEQIEERRDPRGVGFYWQDWKKKVVDRFEGSDVQAVEEGFVSVTPLHPCLTNFEALSFLNNGELLNGADEKNR
ncbi:MAG: 5'/3'-nucleotidase SurE [bacterium]